MMVMIMMYVADTSGLSTALEIPDINRQLAFIYPNPATDYFTLELPNWNGVADFSLYSITGQLVYQKTIHSNHTEMLLPTPLARGIYYYRLQTNLFTLITEGKLILE